MLPTAEKNTDIRLFILGLVFFLGPQSYAATPRFEPPAAAKHYLTCGIAIVASGIAYHYTGSALSNLWWISSRNMPGFQASMALPAFWVGLKTARKLMELRNPFTLYDVLANAGLLLGAAAGSMGAFYIVRGEIGPLGPMAGGVGGSGMGWLVANLIDMTIRRHVNDHRRLLDDENWQRISDK